MSDNSANLTLPYILPAQAQKHVTHNEALRRLDALVQLAVASASDVAPPAVPEDGQCYIVPASASGAWSGQDTRLAVFEETAWVFFEPKTGWRAWVADAGEMQVWDGAAWISAAGAPDFQNLDLLGVQTTADTVNRLAVASEATLFTHAGAGHQLKLNKAAAGDTASLLFQTGFAGRAELGTAGTDDFSIKVSDDGSSFATSILADHTTGRVSFPSGVDGLSDSEFGAGSLVTTDYVASRGLDLVTNGTGVLGNGYNYPANFTYDPAITPSLPAGFAFEGHYSGAATMAEPVAVDPNRIYRLSAYLRQESVAGDFSAFANEERHLQYMGLLSYDLDGNAIGASHHMRHYQSGVDSLTTLTAPLAPGDTTVSVVDATGWNDSSSAGFKRGLIVFGYRNSVGYQYPLYSRIQQDTLFELGQVDKTNHIITLNQPLPVSMGNPDDPSGIWPIGTSLANSSGGSSHKYAFFSALTLAQTDTWYQTTHHIGGIDRSGTNVSANFTPGTALVRPFWLANYSNRAGGFAPYPDTGTGHKVWFTGTSVVPELLGAMQTNANGSQALKVPVADFASGSLELAAPVQKIIEA